MGITCCFMGFDWPFSYVLFVCFFLFCFVLCCVVLCFIFTRKWEYFSGQEARSPEEHPTVGWQDSALQVWVHTIHSWTTSGRKETLLGTRYQHYWPFADSSCCCCSCSADNADSVDAAKVAAALGWMADVVQPASRRRCCTAETPDNSLWPTN